ncbi:MAG: DUF1326 domain-containing protein [Acidobacteriota bacterium]
MAWNLSAEIVETCSCNMLCPCWFAVQDLMLMDRGWCAGTFFFRIRDGRSGAADLGGRTVVVTFDFPGPTLFDGNATARVHIDEGATADQRRELEAIFQGKKGGPMEILAALITNWLPTVSSKLDMQDDGETLTAKVGDFGRIESEVLKNEAGAPMTLQNAGFAVALQFQNQTFKLAPSGTKWSDPGMPHQFETRSGARSNVSWSVN